MADDDIQSEVFNPDEAPEDAGPDSEEEVLAAAAPAADPEPSPSKATVSASKATVAGKPAGGIVPLGKATSKTLLECDLQPFILDKMFHQGKMSRIGAADGVGGKIGGEGGIITYEDYKWQLEKMFRTVPENMSVGHVRSKPDSLLYEEEHFILGKLERSINESQGYNPIAGKRESTLDFKPNVTIPANLPPEPAPCPFPTGDAYDEICGGYAPPVATTPSQAQALAQQAPAQSAQPPAPPPPQPTCFTKVQKGGKVYEFNYMPVTAISVNSKSAGVQCTKSNVNSVCSKQAVAGGGGGGPALTQTFPPPTGGAASSAQGGQDPCSGGGGQCKNNLPCESKIQAVCNAARNAMAIYDTITGCDNFPCNVGDRPELEMQNVEDGVWSWLYNLILKMVPVETDANCNNI